MRDSSGAVGARRRAATHSNGAAAAEGTAAAGPTALPPLRAPREPAATSPQLLGCGTYGVVVTPPLQCDPTFDRVQSPVAPPPPPLPPVATPSGPVPPPPHACDPCLHTPLGGDGRRGPPVVGKVASLSNGWSELRRAALFAVADPHGAYGVYPDSLCYLPPPQDLHALVADPTVRDALEALRARAMRVSLADAVLCQLHMPRHGGVPVTEAVAGVPRTLGGAAAVLGGLLHMLRALGHYHAHGLVQGDVKPSNVLARTSVRGGAPVLDVCFIDFGYGQALRAWQASASCFHSSDYRFLPPHAKLALADVTADAAHAHLQTFYASLAPQLLQQHCVPLPALYNFVAAAPAAAAAAAAADPRGRRRPRSSASRGGGGADTDSDDGGGSVVSGLASSVLSALSAATAGLQHAAAASGVVTRSAAAAAARSVEGAPWAASAADVPVVAWNSAAALADGLRDFGARVAPLMQGCPPGAVAALAADGFGAGVVLAHAWTAFSGHHMSRTGAVRPPPTAPAGAATQLDALRDAVSAAVLRIAVELMRLRCTVAEAATALGLVCDRARLLQQQAGDPRGSGLCNAAC